MVLTFGKLIMVKENMSTFWGFYHKTTYSVMETCTTTAYIPYIIYHWCKSQYVANDVLCGGLYTMIRHLVDEYIILTEWSNQTVCRDLPSFVLSQ